MTVAPSTRCPWKEALRSLSIVFGLGWLLLAFLVGSTVGQNPAPTAPPPPEEEQKCDPIMEGPTPPEAPEGACLGQQGGPDNINMCTSAYTSMASGGATNLVHLVTQTEQTFATMLGAPRETVSWLGYTNLGGMESGGPTSNFVNASPAAKSLLGHSDDLNIYDLDPGSMPSGLELLSHLRGGSVEIGQLGLVWGERDSTYRGVTAESDLVIGRRYFSRLDFNGVGSVGRHWVHSLYERLIVVDATHLRVVDWNSPYNDPDGYFTQTGPGVWRAAAYRGATALLASDVPGATHKVKFKDGRTHHYDSAGRILVRADYSGLNTISFRYTNGHLDRVIDSRGHQFHIGTTGGYITSIMDDLGNTIQYTLTGEDLTQVTYPARDVLESNQEGGPGPSTVFRNTLRTFTYDVNGKLAQIINDSGQLVMAFGYQAQNPCKISLIMNAQGGLWRFFDFSSTGWIFVATPRGFVRGHRLNTENESVEMRQYIQSIDATTPSRPIPPGNPGYWAWLFNRSGTCNCGAITQVVEPDGGSFDVTYDSRLNILSLDKKANGGGTAFIRYSWTWDSQDRVSTFTPPEAHASGNLAGYTVTVARTVDSAPDNPGGEVLTISTPAGGIRPNPSVWTMRTDTRRRIKEWSGADHGTGVLGYYAYYNYYPSGGVNSNLLQRHSTRRDGSIWTEFTYDIRGQIVHAVLNTGDTFDQTWTGDGLLASWSGPVRAGQQYQALWYYDGDDRVGYYRWRYFDQDPYLGVAANPTWADQSFTWDGGDNLISRTSEMGDGTTPTSLYFYDLDENLLGVIDGDGKISGAIRDERNLPWVLYDAVGTAEQVQREYFYNAQGEIERSVSPFGTGTYTDIRYTYNQFDQETEMEVVDQNKVVEDIDAADRVTRRSVYGRVNNAWAEVERLEFGYADWHASATQETRIVRSEDGSAVVRSIPTTIEYAASGKPLVVTAGGSVAARFHYTSWGAPDDVYDDLGNRDQFVYDPATGYVATHRIITMDPINNNASSYERTLVNDPAGRVLQATYAAQGQPSRTEVFGYDSFDNVVSFVDSGGKYHSATYRFDGRVKSVSRAGVPGSGTGASTEVYSWSPGGRIVTARDNRQKTVTWTYDGRGRKTAEIQPDGSAWQWSWNQAGFINTATTPTGKTLTYGHNPRGLPSGRSITQGGQLLRTDTWTWTPSGHLDQATKVEGGITTWTSFDRDGDGAIKSETTDSSANTVLYTRDSLGRISSITGPSGFSRGFGYDDHHRVTSLTDGGATPVATMSYVGSGRALRERLLRGGMSVSVDRDGFGRLSRLHTKNGTSTLFDLSYDFDPEGMLKWEHRVHEGKGDVFRYDSLDRLSEFVRESTNPAVEWNSPGATPRLLSKSYSLDADNHRTSVTTVSSGGSTSTETYATDPDRHQYTNVGGTQRVSNLNGSVTSIGNRTFTYDALESVTGVTDGGVLTAAYSYDALDRRVAKTVGGVTRRFVYAGPWVIEETRDSGGTQVLEAVNYHVSGVDEIVMSRRLDVADLDADGNTTELLELYLHVNHQGSVLDITLANGQIVESYRYDAFGAPTIRDRLGNTVTAPPSGNRFLYTGREYDSETGLYHYRARTYDPSTGTFLQEDPLGLVDGLNPVSYVLGNPLLFTDPYGTLSVSEAVDSVMNFLSENAGTLASIAVDVIPFLSDIIDLLSAASGRDIRGWIDGGFKGQPAEMGWWARAKAAASGAIGLVGSAIGTIAKIDKVIDKIKNALKAKNNAKAAALANACPGGCFAPGTMILLADGSTKPIEEVEIGDEVVCVLLDLPFAVPEYLRSTEPDHYRTPSSHDWMQISLEATASDQHGLRLTLARPKAWIHQERVTVGSRIPLTLTEMGVEGDFLVTEVAALDYTPSSATTHGMAGQELIPGRIVASFPVTGTFRREVDSALSISTGESDFIVTSDHLLHSASRGSWVRAGDLEVGETLTGRSSSSTIQRILPVEGPLVVFNMEVHRGHSYFVGPDAILAHNTYPDGSAQMKKLTGGEIKELQKQGIDPHDLKPNSKYDLFKDKDGNIFVKPKDGSGPGDPTGINING